KSGRDDCSHARWSVRQVGYSSLFVLLLSEELEDLLALGVSGVFLVLLGGAVDDLARLSVT
ncbi:MAG TPA: hypothetical protein VMY40_13640, partial [Anaerolineae bacterium]|nr:hypothetical protein [Anaerolineae bacterium]